MRLVKYNFSKLKQFPASNLNTHSCYPAFTTLEATIFNVKGKQTTYHNTKNTNLYQLQSLKQK